MRSKENESREANHQETSRRGKETGRMGERCRLCMRLPSSNLAHRAWARKPNDQGHVAAKCTKSPALAWTKKEHEPGRDHACPPPSKIPIPLSRRAKIQEPAPRTSTQPCPQTAAAAMSTRNNEAPPGRRSCGRPLDLAPFPIRATFPERRPLIGGGELCGSSGSFGCGPIVVRDRAWFGALGRFQNWGGRPGGAHCEV
ncbi:hypothetical protein VUR80DRAFT_5908 [Thermomyces stellatus]